MEIYYGLLANFYKNRQFFKKYLRHSLFTGNLLY